MKLALIQQHAGEDREQNLERGLAAAEAAAEAGAQLIGFAELAFERFHPVRPATRDAHRLAETVPGPTTEAFCELARRRGVVLVPNLFERDGERCYDCSPVIDADGSLLGRTRMLHVPDYACFHERGYYTPGDTGLSVYATACGRLGVAICYDRHYPEVMRGLALAGAELVLVPQAGATNEWPDGLYEAELRVAAFQNGYFTALCNRVGAEPGIEFAGESFVCDPDGKVLARAASGADQTLLCEVDLSRVESSHGRRLFLPDRRPELYGDWLG